MAVIRVEKAGDSVYADGMNLRDKRVLVTGGGGFLGSFLMERLRSAGVHQILAPRSKEVDFRDPDQIRKCFESFKPQVVIHIAAVVGGIGANRKHPGKFFYENAVMGIHLLEACRLHSVEKTVILGTICAYPKFAEVPFLEDKIWDGYPEETNAPYGLAKKMLLVQAQAYRQEYGCNMIYLLPVNLYGPRDNFNPESSHVIPALIKKAVEAKAAEAPAIECWGTGSATREFLYVEDCVDGILAATERYNGADPVNLGSGMEISIRDLVGIICREVGYKGEIRWDSSKPDGQPRRCLDVLRARSEFGFQARTDFVEGLRKTIQWYVSQGQSGAKA
jgi:GDP-L-fucose synthase